MSPGKMAINYFICTGENPESLLDEKDKVNLINLIHFNAHLYLVSSHGCCSFCHFPNICWDKLKIVYCKEKIESNSSFGDASGTTTF